MRLGYFGGSFDPPHLGHVAAAAAAAAAFSLEHVWFVPTGRQPLKAAGAEASFTDRLAMTDLLCRSADPALFEAMALDAPRADGEPNYTVDALRRLVAERPASEVFVLVGMDAFLGLRSWREPDRLLELARWIVVSRPGFSLGELETLELTPTQLGRVHLLAGVGEPANATSIREDLRAGSNCAGLLVPEVLAYIRSHHLYGTSPQPVALG